MDFLLKLKRSLEREILTSKQPEYIRGRISVIEEIICKLKQDHGLGLPNKPKN